MNGSPVSLDYCDPILGKLNGYGNLQPLFHEFATLLANGHYREIAKDKKLRCFERGYYARETGEKSLYPGVSELELKVGFADIPFEQAILLAKNQTELRHRYVRGERLFSVDADGNVSTAGISNPADSALSCCRTMSTKHGERTFLPRCWNFWQKNARSTTAFTATTLSAMFRDKNWNSLKR